MRILRDNNSAHSGCLKVSVLSTVCLKQVVGMVVVALAVWIGVAPTAPAQCPDPRYTFTGEGSWDYFGHSVSGAGDVNNDGFADVIVGAYKYPSGSSKDGRAYVFSGLTGDTLWIFTGEAEGGLGHSVSGAGDVNNDGYDDMIVGEPYNNPGRAYVFSGQTGDTIWTLIGEGAGGVQFGQSVSGAGDVNNDGYADVVVGAPYYSSRGGAFIYSGQTGSLLWTFEGEENNDYFGGSVSGGGDVDDDGYDDVIVGAIGKGAYVGEVYVFSGQTGDTLWTFPGEVDSNYFGYSVSMAGDVNNDGYCDVILGSYFNKVGPYFQGRAYVFSGQTGDTIYTFTGEGETDCFSISVSGAGDVDNDGYADVIVGACRVANLGRAYVYSGQTGDTLWIFNGRSTAESFGHSVSGAGDVNDDGYDDLIVGDPFDDLAGDHFGIADVYTCRPFTPGDCNGDGEIAVEDVVCLISYLFRDGSAPDPFLAGDATCDEDVTVDDVVYLISYLFRNGPSPECGSSINENCKSSPTYPDPDSIIITVWDHNITVLHADAFYNCCFEITTQVVQEDGLINLYEQTSGDPCYCMCYLDITTTIYDLEPGTYTISVYNADGEYVGGGNATVY